MKGRYDGGHFQDRNFGILFASPSIQAAYYELLSHDCPLCSTNHRRFSFKNFQKLKEHMRKDHELYYCDLCVDNLNIFTFERKCYNRTELAQHRRKGDVDNTSHRYITIKIFFFFKFIAFINLQLCNFIGVILYASSAIKDIWTVTNCLDI